MIYYYDELFANIDGIKGGVVKPMQYQGWISAIELGWPSTNLGVNMGGVTFRESLSPPSFQNDRCTLATGLGDHTGKLMYNCQNSTVFIKTVQIHWNKGRFSLRMLLEDVFIVGCVATARASGERYDRFTFEAAKGSGSLLMGPRAPD